MRVTIEAALAAGGVPITADLAEGGRLSAALVAAVGIDRSEDGRRLCVVELDFWQSVVLERGPDRPAFGAITWSVERYASVTVDEAADYAEQRIADLAQLFAQDWQAAQQGC